MKKGGPITNKESISEQFISRLMFGTFSKTFVWLFFILVIVVCILLFGHPLGIFGGKTAFPFGDDSPAHMVLIDFVADNLPHTNWYPNWYGGATIQRYNPLAYTIWGAFTSIINCNVEITIFFFTFISICFIGFGIHGLVYELTKDRFSAIIAPIILITSAMFYSPLTLGATFARYFAVMFWMLSLWALVNYLKTKNRMSYLTAVILIVFAIATNLLIGALVVLTTGLVLLFCSKNLKDLCIQILKIGLPVIALLAFLVIPLVFNKSTSEFVSQMEHYSIPVSMEYFIFTSTPPLFICAISLIANKFIQKDKLQESRTSLGFQNALLVAIVFVFFYGFTDTQTFRFFSTYDAPWYLIIYFSIYTGIVLSKFIKNSKGEFYSKLKLTDDRTISLRSFFKFFSLNEKIFFSLLLVGLIVLVPIQHSKVQFVAPFSESWDYPQYIAEQFLVLDENETNYRFATDWIHIQRWFNLKYNIPQVAGAQDGTNLYPDWYNWFEESVFVNTENYYETNFLLDWYAVKDFIISDKLWHNGGGDLYLRYGPVDKFLNRSDYYTIVSNITVPDESYWTGSVYQFGYEYSRPIISTSDATTLLVVGSNDVYDNVLHSLSLSGYDSRFLIPIRGSEFIDDYSLAELNSFSVIYVSECQYYDFEKAWNLLKEYVSDGGGLIIESGSHWVESLPVPSPVAEIKRLDKTCWNFTYANSLSKMWINPAYFSTPLGDYSVGVEDSVEPWAETILWSHGDPILVIGDYGQGHVVWSGINLAEQTVSSRNYVEATTLPALIEWVTDSQKRISVTQSNIFDSTLGWEIDTSGNDGIRANLNITISDYIEGETALFVAYHFNGTEDSNQEWVGYVYNFSESIDLSSQDLASFWLYGDGSGNELKFVMLAPDWNNYLQLYLDVNWNGWKEIVIPITQMGVTGSPDLSSIKHFAFFVSENESAENDGWSYLCFDDMNFASQAFNYFPKMLDITFDRPYPTTLTINVTGSCDGLLFKESYFKDWNAYAVDDNNLEVGLEIYPAGPDLMYIAIPDGLNFPLIVILDFEISVIELSSYVISIISLLCFVSYCLWFDKIKFLSTINSKK